MNDAIRAQFPILHQNGADGRPLVYLDNAASSQRPSAVIEAVRRYEEHDHANVHRGVHELSRRATEAFEAARGKVAGFLNAHRPEEIIFTRGCTDAINLVAASIGTSFGPEDEIVLTQMEHHSNIVPWQMVAERTGATIRVANVNDDGSLDLDHLLSLLSDQTAIVAVVHVSNALGTINPVAEIVRAAHEFDALVLLDGAQATPHSPVDVQALGCDFYTLSAHKMYGPTGVGVLWAPYDLLAEMPPYQGGGDMIDVVSFEGTTYTTPPSRFEAGTPNISGAVGMGAAVDWIQGVGIEVIEAHEAMLLAHAMEKLDGIEGLRVVGTAPHKAGVISFVVDGVHPHDIGTLLDEQGIAVRTGHHCTQPLMKRLGVPATARASFAVYNTVEEVDRFAEAVRRAVALFV